MSEFEQKSIWVKEVMSQVPARTLQPPPCPKHHHPHSCLFHDFLYTSRPNLWVNNREPQCILRAWVPQSLYRGEKPANEKQLFWSFNEQEIKLLLCLSHYLVLDFVVAVIVARVTLYKVDRVYTFTFYLLPFTCGSLYQIWNLLRGTDWPYFNWFSP